MKDVIFYTFLTILFLLTVAISHWFILIWFVYLFIIAQRATNGKF